MATKLSDIESYVELSKRKCELELMLLLLENSPEKEELAKKEIERMSGELANFSEKISKEGLHIALPNENAITDALAFIRNAKREDTLASVKSKSGEFYDSAVLAKSMLRDNHENRGEIAKACALVSRLPSGREAVEGLIRKGDLDGALSAVEADEKTKNVLARIFLRLARKNSEEAAMVINNRRVWVEKGMVAGINDIIARSKVFSTKMQVMAAQKQGGLFNEEKEKAFTDLQGEYLKLLKEQDEMLKLFNEEAKLVGESTQAL